jgi:hypothetical protein
VLAKPLITAATAIILSAISVPAGSPMSAAAPAGFPDLNAFTPVDTNIYIVGNPRSATIGFVAPGGVACTWRYSSDPHDHDAVKCSGDIPGVPASASDNGNGGCAQVEVAGYPASRTGPYVFTRSGGACPPSDSSLLPLNVGQKLSATNVTCVVGANDLTACIDTIENHGFVLQPSGSSVF